MTNKTRNQPLITVVTITFNIIKAKRQKYFEQCCKSVHDQTYKNIEHLIIDGGSNDGTIKILEKYNKKKWINYISEPDSGKYDAMNKGIKLSKGKYITFLNSDDFYHNTNGLKLSMEQILRNNADFSYAPVINYSEKINRKEIFVPDISKVFFTIVPNHQTIIYKKSVIVNEGMFNTKYDCLADYDLTVRLCLKNIKSTYVNADYVTYRVGGYSADAEINGITLKEEIQIYYDHYNQLCKLSKRECSKIIGKLYHGRIEEIPLKLALKLAQFQQYFDFEKYIDSLINKNLVIKQTRQIHNNISITNTELKIINGIRKIKHKIIPENSLRFKIFSKLKT